MYTALDLVENFLKRFVSYPSEHACVAHVLWTSHCHLMDLWDTTPRLAFMSAEKASGKTRALEVTALLVPTPILSISTSPAAIIRLIAKERPTVLYDEIDGVFGNAKAQEANVDLRSVLNGGYRRGAKVYRCTTHGKKVGIEALDSFCAVAVAGLRDLPDTLASRAIIIRMKRRAPDEDVTPFRYRYHVDEAKPIREEIEEWAKEHEGNLIGAEPEMPSGIEDRDADAWEPLLAIADEAGQDWPERARNAAVYLAKAHVDDLTTKGVELLRHIKEVLQSLCNRDESPWMEVNYGKPLNERGLALRLKPYGVRSKDVKVNGVNRKGYAAADFHDAWKRYVGGGSKISATSATSATNLINKDKKVAEAQRAMLAK
jgi:Protein of unknown function (DUF3631)